MLTTVLSAYADVVEQRREGERLRSILKLLMAVGAAQTPWCEGPYLFSDVEVLL
jgi:hypothetical protein